MITKKIEILLQQQIQFMQNLFADILGINLKQKRNQFVKLQQSLKAAKIMFEHQMKFYRK